MLTVLGGLGEFEPDLIRTQTGNGPERAKARGVKLGRLPKMTPHRIEAALRRRDVGRLCWKSPDCIMSATIRLRGSNMPPKPAGTCIFCGAGNLSKEHFWPDWALSLLPNYPINQHVERILTFTQMTELKEAPKTRTKPGHAWTKKFALSAHPAITAPFLHLMSAL